jgi:hypothetical protein
MSKHHKKKPKRRRVCGICRCWGITNTSGYDGRPAYVCQACGHFWTEGKKPGQGYKDWPGYQSKKQEGT